MNNKSDKLKKTLALIGAIILMILFITMVIIGIFFPTKFLGVFITLIAVITILAVLFYVILMYLKLKK